MDITKKLLSLKEEAYGDFQAKIVPNIERERIIGIRIPVLRQLAKELKGQPEVKEFFNMLPHKYYEENILHIILIEDIRDYEECMEEIEKFLPYMDCWAVTDDKIPKVLSKHREELIKSVYRWIQSKETYTCRYGLHMLMSQYLDDDFKPEYLEIAASVRSEEYYVNMMNAWCFATALAKQWDATIPYIEKNELDIWTHNKTIQKAIESYRVTKEHKEYLRTLKR
ncbi:MAG: DNA alkylation repair protein [Lachnospiraceae bacterium]|nr:DNA alkylation repair protein [Lachnospiraceae bacterium]